MRNSFSVTRGRQWTAPASSGTGCYGPCRLPKVSLRNLPVIYLFLCKLHSLEQVFPATTSLSCMTTNSGLALTTCSSLSFLPFSQPCCKHSACFGSRTSFLSQFYRWKSKLKARKQPGQNHTTNTWGMGTGSDPTMSARLKNLAPVSHMFSNVCLALSPGHATGLA